MHAEGDLISRSDLIKATADYRCGLYGARRESVEVIFKYIEDAPAIDAEPVRHGRWIDPDKYDIWDCYQCSECHSLYIRENNYCANCGAKMDALQLQEGYKQGYRAGFEAARSEWISVDERLPEDAIDVLVFVRNGNLSYTCIAHTLKGRWLSRGILLDKVTHWMGIPDPPKEADK